MGSTVKPAGPNPKRCWCWVRPTGPNNQPTSSYVAFWVKGALRRPLPEVAMGAIRTRPSIVYCQMMKEVA